MSMTQEKMYMNVDDVCAVLGVSKAFAYKIKHCMFTCQNTSLENEFLIRRFWNFPIRI